MRLRARRRVCFVGCRQAAETGRPAGRGRIGSSFECGELAPLHDGVDGEVLEEVARHLVQLRLASASG